MSEHTAFLADFENYLSGLLGPVSMSHPTLHAAMTYSLLSPGKRLRPRLVQAVSLLGEDPGESLLPAAAAVECLHSYSLIHDDLPAIDNDDYRRGQASCHRQFGEAMAILAGDALQALAFESLTRALSHASLDKTSSLEIINRFSRMAGMTELVGGQAADMEPIPSFPEEELLPWIHGRKTAAMIRFCFSLGASLAGVKADLLHQLESAGEALGLAFQAVDDCLDKSADAGILGKTPGKDAEQGKLTYVKVLGLDRAREAAQGFHQKGLDMIPDSIEAAPLRELARLMVDRDF
ncbi:MAG: polyprenyl synthetase family protein [Candidatus Krumholzibacteria bacterium]|jgi:geranylgeranyl pyrophosphate synthase|nr:polyprenyl synthetase family protein [Candidatus Krumholzibacteria bacterium]MDP6669167.1 polyprenyl synthetase family protein [Candidatus Krumholzibacteria bacterium]MDP6797407.1 polyprenyl synthetase family protein [Candidatus Krumholzibacteria bacterium]MDP7020865.1 polyprenyl synthetase family protein [Candidatus Krumholzibacteria bacterium]